MALTPLRLRSASYEEFIGIARLKADQAKTSLERDFYEVVGEVLTEALQRAEAIQEASAAERAASEAGASGGDPGASGAPSGRKAKGSDGMYA